MPGLVFCAVLLCGVLADETVSVEEFGDKVVDSDDVWLIRFTSDTRKPWAPVCKKVNEPWKELGKAMKRMRTASFDVTEVDSEATKLAKRYGAMSQGLPNVMLFKTKQGAPVNVLASESADLKKLKKRIARQVKGMKKDADGKFIKDPAKPIKVLDDHNFQAEIAVGTATAEKVVFVKFYRTGCNHCQALKPIWEKMGKEIVDAGHKHVVLAEVECETNSKTCSKEGVSSHPTLIKYTQEEMKKEFPGEVYQMKKESPDMKEFVLDPAAYKVKLDKVIADDKKEKDAKKKEL